MSVNCFVWEWPRMFVIETFTSSLLTNMQAYKKLSKEFQLLVAHLEVTLRAYVSGSHVILDVFANARSQSCVRITNRSNVSHAKSSGLIVPEGQVNVGVEIRIQRILCDGLPKKTVSSQN